METVSKHTTTHFLAANMNLSLRAGNGLRVSVRLKKAIAGSGREYSILSHNEQSGRLILDNEDVFLVMRPVGAFEMNEYFVACKKTGEAALIDSGESSSNYFSALAAQHSYSIKHLIQTHAHIDHVTGLVATKEEYPDAPVYLHPSELPVYEQIEQQVRMFGVPCDAPLPPVDVFVEEGTGINVGGIDLDIMLTPGHSPGSIVLFHNHAENPFAFVGDLIFEGSVGRTDLPGCNHADMQESVKRVCDWLPENSILLPGHMGVTTMGKEKKSNMYVRDWANV